MSTTQGPGVRPRRGRAARVSSVVVGVLILGLVAVLATREGGDRAATSPLLGELVPEVAGIDMDGEPYDIDERRGEWVLVNFFATWCTPCVLEHPELVAFSESTRDRGASVVSVAFDDDPDAIARFFEERGGEWPVLVEETGSIAVGFGVTGVPESYLVAPDGTVVAKWISGVRATDVEETITAFEAQAAQGASAGGEVP